MSISDVSSYKKCYLKQWSGYICKLPCGSIICDSKVVYSSEEAMSIRCTNPASYNNYKSMGWVLLDPSMIFLCDPLGEIVAVDSGFIFNNNFVDSAGRRITREYLIANSYSQVKDMQDDVYYAVKERCKERYFPDTVFDWILVRCIPSNVAIQAACFVPKKDKINLGAFLVNDPYVKFHGKGDFVVCNLVNGQPDLQSRFIVLGDRFAAMYNNRGWENCISSNLCLNTVMPSSMLKFTQVKSDSSIADKIVGNLMHDIQTGSLCTVDVNISVLGREVLDNGNGAVIIFGMQQIICSLADLYGELHLKVQYEKFSFHRAFKYKEEDKVRQMLILIFCLQPKGWRTGLSLSRPASESEVGALMYFTGAGYAEVNSAMWNGEVDDFDTWYMCHLLYHYLQDCRVRGVRLFRAMSLDNKVAVGDKIECDSFSSWSLYLKSSLVFGDTVFYMDVRGVDAAYVNDISDFRNAEYEVLLNAGYTLEVIEQTNFGDVSFNKVKIKKNPDNIKLDLSIEDDVIGAKGFYKVVAQALSFAEPILLNVMMVGEPKMVKSENIGTYGLHLRTYKSKIDLYLCDFEPGTHAWRTGDGKEKFCEDFGEIPDKVDAVCRTLVSFIQELDEAVTGSKADLYTQFSRFMMNMTNYFGSEGFQIIDADFTDRYDIDNKSNLTGKIVINGDNDDHISLHFKIDGDVLNIRARSNNKKMDGNFSYSDADVYKKIYHGVVRNFSLNQYHRIERALRLVGKFLKKEFHSDMKGFYTVGEDVVQAAMEGTVAHVFLLGGPEVSVNYWDSINDIVRRVRTLWG